MQAIQFRSLAFIACLAAEVATAAPVGPGVELVVKNVASDQGNIVAVLCDEKGFMANCRFKAAAKASPGSVSLRFPEVPPGRYAAVVFHDENANMKLDRDSLGIPTEGFGTSRHARGRRGPPQFSDAAFELGLIDLSVEITLDY